MMTLEIGWWAQVSQVPQNKGLNTRTLGQKIVFGSSESDVRGWWAQVFEPFGPRVTMCLAVSQVTSSLHKKRCGRECLFRKKWANMLYGRDFTSDILWSGFLFKHFLVERSLPEKTVANVSPRNLFGSAFFSDIFGRTCLQTFLAKEFSSKRRCGRECLFRKNGQTCYVVEISLLIFFGRDFSSNIFW